MKILRVAIVLTHLGQGLATIDCGFNCSCSSISSENIIESIRNVPDENECQSYCNKNMQCDYFTYYNSHAQLGLSGSCHLFSRCDLKCGCSGCFTGPKNCSASCDLPSNKGGNWYCQGGHACGSIPSLRRCFYTCPTQKLQVTTCLSGKWDKQIEGNKKFQCQFRELTPDEEESPTSSSSPPSWLAFIVGAVSGAVVITMFVTSLLIFRMYKRKKPKLDEQDIRIPVRQYFNSGSLGLETKA